MSHLAHASEPIGGSPMSWTGPCDKCGRTSESCTRFREAQKPELSGKQVCTTRACQIWGGNRDEEKEAATKAAAKELKQRERDAAQALAGAAAVAAGTHVVSPRRQAQATALPADAQVQQPQPAVPLPSRPASRSTNPTSRRTPRRTFGARGRCALACRLRNRVPAACFARPFCDRCRPSERATAASRLA